MPRLRVCLVSIPVQMLQDTYTYHHINVCNAIKVWIGSKSDKHAAIRELGQFVPRLAQKNNKII